MGLAATCLCFFVGKRTKNMWGFSQLWYDLSSETSASSRSGQIGDRQPMHLLPGRFVSYDTHGSFHILLCVAWMSFFMVGTIRCRPHLLIM